MTFYNTSTKVDSFTIDKDNPANSTQLTLTASQNTQVLQLLELYKVDIMLLFQTIKVI